MKEFDSSWSFGSTEIKSTQAELHRLVMDEGTGEDEGKE